MIRDAERREPLDIRYGIYNYYVDALLRTSLEIIACDRTLFALAWFGFT